jgi:hypothetical protein
VLGRHPYARSLAVRDGRRWWERAAARPGLSSAGQGRELTCGTHVSAAGVREGGFARKTQFQRENIFSEIRQELARGPDGPTNEVAACGGGGPAR